MPIFEFRCLKCSYIFEQFTQAAEADSAGAACPKCGATKSEKVFSIFSSQCPSPSGGSSSGCGTGGFS